MTSSLDNVLDTLDSSVAEVHRYVLDQHLAMEDLVARNQDLYTTLDRKSGTGWVTILSALVVAFVYGAWFGVVQCPK